MRFIRVSDVNKLLHYIFLQSSPPPHSFPCRPSHCHSSLHPISFPTLPFPPYFCSSPHLSGQCLTKNSEGLGSQWKSGASMTSLERDQWGRCTRKVNKLLRNDYTALRGGRLATGVPIQQFSRQFRLQTKCIPPKIFHSGEVKYSFLAFVSSECIRASFT